MKYNFPFAQTASTTRIRKDSYNSSLSASGSLAHDWENRYLHASTNRSVGRGGLSIVPFLDMNNNGSRDPSEKLIEGLGVISQGGDLIENTRDSITRINGLELYTPHLLEFSESNFNSISWQLENRIVKVYPDPNQFKQVLVPVISVGEAYGMVFIRKDGRDIGQGRIRVNYFNDNNEQVYTTLSESDGYFTYFGLTPGKYYAALDSMQLKRVNLTALEDSIPFEIEGTEMGDLVGDLNFILIPPYDPDSDTVSNAQTEKEKYPTDTIVNDTLVSDTIISDTIVSDTIIRDTIATDTIVANTKDRDTIIFKGQLLDKETMMPVEGHVEIIDLVSNKLLDYKMTKPDSGFFSFSIPSRNKYMIEIIAKDYMFFYETLPISQMGKDSLYKKVYLLERLETDKNFQLNNIFFEINKADLRVESFRELEILKRMLDENPDLQIEIHGHTDNTGDYEFNMILSNDRAESVMNYLITEGVESHRLDYKGFGPSKPVSDNETEEGKQLNRRVEFIVFSNQ